MKRVLLLFIICFCLFVITGCGAPMTSENPFGFVDPNGVKLFFDAGVKTGQAIQGVGTATGNPAMLAYGAGLVIISGYLTILL